MNIEYDKYYQTEKLFGEIIKSYKISKNAKKVFERIEQVEKRGRYKH